MTSPAKSKWILVLIGIEKLTKAALLILVAIQVHRLILSPNAADTVAHWVHQDTRRSGEPAYPRPDFPRHSRN